MARCVDCNRRCGFLSFTNVYTCDKCGSDVCGSCVERSTDGNFCKRCWNPRSSACFIATACYGVNSESVKIFRNWKDEKLLKNKFGRKFVSFYYKTSPPIARFISNKPRLKKIVRSGLNPIKKLIS